MLYIAAAEGWRQNAAGQSDCQIGAVVSSADPEHHPDCEPVEEEQLLATEIDREARKSLKSGKVHNAQEAWNKVMSNNCIL